MIIPRIIPVILLKEYGLVKTVNFNNPTYIGDPINAVKILNDKEVDELILLDIDASPNQIEPNYTRVREIVSESFMPIGYGGGLRNIEQVKKIFDVGVEKVIINSSLFDFNLIESIAKVYGNQSIAISLDIRKSLFGEYHIYTNSGSIKHKVNLIELSNNLVNSGAGELIIQSIDNDGKMKGYDYKLINIFSRNVNVPIIALGGAGLINDFKDVIENTNCSAVAAGSIFVYKGSQNGILINYPTRDNIIELFKK
jgi:cyclase